MKTLEQLAREAGFGRCDDMDDWWRPFTTIILERFRSLCRAEAMEEAAQLCEQLPIVGKNDAEATAYSNGQLDCAAAIREQIK